ncbi:hypothetical protein SDC9_167722 [bioreactor metagenome]|uniref:Uncharacterized protein n=1 Tax=bioreactor metagenome TaxID=1076179 RepID=A0A645G8B3_9ZZZZ
MTRPLIRSSVVVCNKVLIDESVSIIVTPPIESETRASHMELVTPVREIIAARINVVNAIIFSSPFVLFLDAM